MIKNTFKVKPIKLPKQSSVPLPSMKTMKPKALNMGIKSKAGKKTKTAFPKIKFEEF